MSNADHESDSRSVSQLSALALLIAFAAADDDALRVAALAERERRF
jgi:hypothetical protein